jgi:DNA polymerase-4
MILHVDMDAFYASVEQLDNPRLRGRCVIVGGTSGRGVVSAASYEARSKGVHSAMPMFQARQKCPEAICIPPRMKRYREISHRIMSLLEDVTPLVEPISVDEAFMDISGLGRLFGPPDAIGRRVKTHIREATGLTCSVGIAPVKFLAKIASDLRKPDGLVIITPEESTVFIRNLPVGKVPGVGRRTLAALENLNIRTLGDAGKYTEEALVRRLGKYGRRLHELSRGIDERPVTPHTPRKSISTETTLSENTRDLERLAAILLRQSEEVAAELRKKEVRARTVTLKLKHADFRLVTRSTTLDSPTQSSETIYKEAAALLDKYRLTGPLRLIGVGGSNLVADAVPVQLDLFGSVAGENPAWEKVDRAMDDIRSRFGEDAVGRAVLDRKGKSVFDCIK